MNIRSIIRKGAICLANDFEKSNLHMMIKSIEKLSLKTKCEKNKAYCSDAIEICTLALTLKF